MKMTIKIFKQEVEEFIIEFYKFKQNEFLNELEKRLIILNREEGMKWKKHRKAVDFSRVLDIISELKKEQMNENGKEK